MELTAEGGKHTKCQDRKDTNAGYRCICIKAAKQGLRSGCAMKAVQSTCVYSLQASLPGSTPQQSGKQKEASPMTRIRRARTKSTATLHTPTCTARSRIPAAFLATTSAHTTEAWGILSTALAVVLAYLVGLRVNRWRHWGSRAGPRRHRWPEGHRKG
jgi:hypothetical protein